MSYEREYNEREYNDERNYRVNIESDNNNNNNNNIQINNAADGWRLRTLYTDTKYVCAARAHDEVLTSDKLFAYQNSVSTHPSCLPVIVKDTTQPYTYYTMKSYGNAQENNYYVNFDDHVSGSAAATSGYHYNGGNSNISNNSNNSNNTFQTEYETEYGTKASFDDSGCAKTYLCSLLGCFVCCLFQMKPV